jgi:hypothetical protein
MRIAERYDLTLMSTKGMGSTSAGQLIERLAGEARIFVLHDFDKSGFSIVGSWAATPRGISSVARRKSSTWACAWRTSKNIRSRTRPWTNLPIQTSPETCVTMALPQKGSRS